MQFEEYRVLVVNLSTQFGGTDVRVLTQLSMLQSYVAECAAIVLQDSPLHERIKTMGLPHYPIPLDRGNPAMIAALRDIMQKKNYHVVDTHNVQSILWGQAAAKLAGVPGRVVTVHSDYLRENPGLKGRLYHTILRNSRIAVKQYIQVTEELQKQALASGLDGRTHWIPNAVIIPETPFTDKITSEYEAWGFAPDDFVLGIVGRLHPVKGHQYLIDAFNQLKDHPKLKLLIVGDGPIADELHAQVNDLNLQDRIHFTGFRQDIEHIMRSIDALVISSLSEAQPFVLLEAAAQSRPVIATKVGGLKTLIRHEDNGILVESEDSQALADAILWLQQHPNEAQQIAQRGYDFIKAEFGVKKMIEQILAVYTKAIHEQ